MNNTTDHEQAVQYWFDKLNPPEAVRDGLRKKFKQLKMTPAQIRADADTLVATPQKQAH